MKKLLLLTGVLVFLLLSCDGLIPGTDPVDGKDPIDESGVVRKNFWAQNLENRTFYNIEAGKLFDGNYCTVWVERGAGISKADAQDVAREFDEKIYPKMLDNFGVTFEDEDGEYTNIVYADIIGDGDGKLCILLLDIKDGYNPPNNRAYTAGYFWLGDLLEKNPNDAQLKYSNECDMIFVDTNPGLKEAKRNTYATLAHEMQHMMSFATGMLVREEDFDTWVDEGLSSAAEWLYFGDHTSSGRVKSYTDNSSGLIDKGNNFFIWDNHANNNYAILDDYSTVYLFFQWLRLQSRSSIYSDIIVSDSADYNAVVDSFDSLGISSWSSLLETWLAANRINASSGSYGYKGEATLKDIRAPEVKVATNVPATATSISLYPGEGVYSALSSSPSPVTTANIKYSYLTANGVQTSFSSGSTTTLLTFNQNTVAGGSAVSGTITGAVASVNEVPEERNVQPELIRLDAGDMLRRNGNLRNNLPGKINGGR